MQVEPGVVVGHVMVVPLLEDQVEPEVVEMVAMLMPQEILVQL
jgi:hypothetical protein